MNTSTAGIALITLLTAATPALGHEQHGHAPYSAGEPGDSQKSARTIEILMNEMDFTPARIEVKRGEQIRFVLRNAGTEDHEFLLATKEENLKHAELRNFRTWNMTIRTACGSRRRRRPSLSGSSRRQERSNIRA